MFRATMCPSSSTLHTRQSSTQNNKYQVSHKYSFFSWWWAHNHQKLVEKVNKHTKKNCAPIWLYLQDCTGMHDQQNVKKMLYISLNIAASWGWLWIVVRTCDLIYLLTAIGLSPGGSSTVHIYTQTVHRTTQNKQYIEQHNNLGECGPCPVLARFTLAFALQLRKKHGKTSVRVATSKNT